jgi:two-component system alkaline phosphatase synthesis response regulator PhoP
MIYIVEDDPSIRELVVYTLRNSGLEAKGFGSGREFRQALAEEMPLLVILDLMLPGEDGLSILKGLRASGNSRRLPVLILSAKGSEYDTVLGLDLGADDYLAKPAGMMELVARVKNLLRRTGGEEQREYKTGGLFISIPRHQVLSDNKEISLTIKEFDLLVYLLKNAGLVLSREQILQAVWGYSSSLETRTVDTHILTLRTKLGPCGSLIKTVRGLGYKAEGPA